MGAVSSIGTALPQEGAPAFRRNERPRLTFPPLSRVILAIAVFLGLAFTTTRLTAPAAGPIQVVDSPATVAARSEIRVVTWNIGYAGLGAAADFVGDGGEHTFPPSREVVLSNLEGIISVLTNVQADVVVLQELAVSSPLNLWVNTKRALDESLRPSAQIFALDVATRLLPPPLRLAHGKAIYSSLDVAAAERVALPLEDEWFAGIVRNNYSMLVARAPIDGTEHEWVIVNVHLAAFDDGTVRRAQLREVLAFANREYQMGNAVIVAGDFNLEFVSERFPSSAPSDQRFWLRRFPFEELPSGWHAGFDPNVPSVRTLAEPYIQGYTYTSITDGFLTSPNITVRDVRGIYTGFAYSDHQPVLGSFVLN